jgi:hypothetical protein
MTEDRMTPQQYIANMLDLFTKGLPRKRLTRLIMTDILLDLQPGTLKTTNELSIEQCQELANRLFPGRNDQRIELEDYSELLTLARNASKMVNDIHGLPPVPGTGKKKRGGGRSPEAIARRKEKMKAKRQVEYEARETKRQAKKQAQRLQSVIQSSPQETILERAKTNLDKLNAWRAKAGLPPVNEVNYE